MELSLGRLQVSFPVAGSGPAPRLPRLSSRYLRLAVVLGLYGVAVFVIHGLATDFRTHAPATASDMGMCHRR